jgi:ferric-dicitrate binding protein FerR (iron transport regulator)
MNPDERLRRRVAALHDSQLDGAQPLGPDAQRRVVARLTIDASRLERQRRQRRVLGASAAGLALAATVVLALRPASQPRQPTAAKPDLPACGLPLVSGAQPFATLADGRRVLTLGTAFGWLIADADADVQVERSSACELTVRLAHGELAGDLHSLRPARLVIRAEQGDVVVTGTRFVVRSGAALEVVLASGVVDVVFADRSEARVQPGTRMHKPGASARAETAQLSAANRQHLDALLDTAQKAKPVAPPPPTAAGHEPSTPAAHAPSPLAPSLLDVAEAARRAGRYADARTAYRAASQRRDSAAEVALLRWVRLELDLADAAAALRVLELHSQRFAHGRLGAEAGWLEVQVRRALHQPERARAAAQELIARHPGTPQAAAASRLVAPP